jgi:hypothetical protein
LLAAVERFQNIDLEMGLDGGHPIRSGGAKIVVTKVKLKHRSELAVDVITDAGGDRRDLKMTDRSAGRYGGYVELADCCTA